MSARSDLPPRLRNWKEGKSQIGIFLRTRQGSTLTLVHDEATEAQETLVQAFFLGLETMPLDVMQALRAWVKSQVNF